MRFCLKCSRPPPSEELHPEELLNYSVFVYCSMRQLIGNLRSIDGVKAVRKQSGPVLKIELFHREIRNSEAVEIKGNLRSISQNIVNVLDDARSEEVFKSWEWIRKPKKQYQETSLGRNRAVSDRKVKGHKPGFYRVSIQE